MLIKLQSRRQVVAVEPFEWKLEDNVSAAPIECTKQPTSVCFVGLI